MIPYGRQDIAEADIAAVVAVLRSDVLTQGPVGPRFEAAAAAATGAAHGVAVSSGTAALHLAYLAAGIGPGSRVWTVPNSFVATANAALYCGATVDFVDIDPVTRTMAPAALALKLEQAERDGCLPDLIVPVHFAGLPAAMAEIAALAARYGATVVEDACHALGAHDGTAPVGACSYSAMTVFSLHPVKIITAGEGGLVATNDARLAARLRLLRSHGITRDPAEMTLPCDGPWFYEQQALGFNYRLTDIQAALGLSQIGRLGAFVARRTALAARYDRALAGLGLGLPRVPAGLASAWHLYVVDWPPASRAEALVALRQAGIGVNVHYIPIHLQPFWRARGFAPGQFPVAERHYAGALSLPLYPRLSDDEQGFVIAQLGALCQAVKAAE